MIVIVDYGMGNLGSIANMIRRIGCENFTITADPALIEQATKIILPGVGAFDNAMERLHRLKMIGVLKEKVIKEKVPILGICLGMQIMTLRSEEGTVSGLSIINAETKRFRLDKKYKIPHMGWNSVSVCKESKIISNMTDQENRFYFVHSYYVDCYDSSDILTLTDYGISFVSSFERENIIGVQFHPEKSHKYGMKLMENFLKRF